MLSSPPPVVFRKALKAIIFLIAISSSITQISAQQGGSVDVTEVSQLKGILHPTISPSGNAVAFFVYDVDHECFRLFISSGIGVAGSEKLLSEDVSEESSIAWKPDSSSLAVLRGGTSLQESSIDIISSGGGILHSFSIEGVSSEGGLSWLSNGELLAIGVDNSFIVVDSKTGEVQFKVEQDKFGLVADLRTFSVSTTDVVAFPATRVGSSAGKRIWTMQLSRRVSKPVPATSGPTDETPEWIGASSIIFSRETPRGIQSERESKNFIASHLWRVDTDSKKEQQLTGGNVIDRLPSWSPAKGIVVYSHIPLSELLPLSEISPDGRLKEYSDILDDLAVSATSIMESSRAGWLKVRPSPRDENL